MAIIVSVINQKGGVGKTTTALCLFDGLQRKDKKCLFIDLDQQGNASLSLGANLNTSTIANVLEKEVETKEAIQKLKRGAVIPAADELAELEEPIDTLENCLKEIKADYDYIVLDTPPSLSSLTANALFCTDLAIIPAQCDEFSLQGIGKLHSVTLPKVNEMRSKLQGKEAVNIAGVLITKYNSRAIYTQAYLNVLQTFTKGLQTKVFNAKIRNCISLQEATTAKQSIFDYAPKSNAAEDYTAFINEFLKEGN